MWLRCLVALDRYVRPIHVGSAFREAKGPDQGLEYASSIAASIGSSSDGKHTLYTLFFRTSSILLYLRR